MRGYAVSYEERQAMRESDIFNNTLHDMADSPFKACITFDEICGDLSVEEIGSAVLQMLANMELRGQITDSMPPVLLSLWDKQIKPAIELHARRAAQ